MIGRHTRFRENGDLPPWRGPAAKKKKNYAQYGCAMQYWGMTLRGLFVMHLFHI